MKTPHRVLVTAYEKGYRISEEGVFTGPKGNLIEVKRRSNHKYPQALMNMDGKRHNMLMHRFAAYCFYGDELFAQDIVVRHLNANVLDVSKENIALGTYSDNEHDKPKETRIKNARNAVLSREDTRRMTMRKLSYDQAYSIKVRLKNGENGAAIAREYNVSKETIYQIKHGETYTDVAI